MKEFLIAVVSALCIIIGMCAVTAQASYSGNCGTGVKYSLNTTIGVLTISGSGDMC